MLKRFELRDVCGQLDRIVILDPELLANDRTKAQIARDIPQGFTLVPVLSRPRRCALVDAAGNVENVIMLDDADHYEPAAGFSVIDVPDAEVANCEPGGTWKGGVFARPQRPPAN
jgi:hypothetical protein